MKKVELLRIIEKFETDMSIGMHTVNAEVGRSFAAQAMRELPPAILFPAVAQYLAGDITLTKSTTRPKAVVDEYIKVGWVLLLYWYKKQKMVDCPMVATSSFHDWCTWLQQKYLQKK